MPGDRFIPAISRAVRASLRIPQGLRVFEHVSTFLVRAHDLPQFDSVIQDGVGRALAKMRQNQGLAARLQRCVKTRGWWRCC
jgi:hypothetical protein